MRFKISKYSVTAKMISDRPYFLRSEYVYKHTDANINRDIGTMMKAYQYLTYVGSIPFLFCALCFIEEKQILPFLGQTDKLLSSYGLIICSFVAGSQWGQHLNLSGNWRIYLPIFSNINAVMLWASFIFFSFKILLMIFIISFSASLLIDKSLFKVGLISKEYFRTRCVVSIIVVMSITTSIIFA